MQFLSMIYKINSRQKFNKTPITLTAGESYLYDKLSRATDQTYNITCFPSQVDYVWVCAQKIAWTIFPLKLMKLWLM